ncbi:MAG: galactose mutarotase [Microthrixaceae bacterium]|nr:galactose mutarotase [Microthrixaceae bacterium]MCO5320186.1 galactose mutarotase [Microthrixaceae bacterium]
MLTITTAGTLGKGTLDPGAEVAAVRVASDVLEVDLLGLGAAISGVRTVDRDGRSGSVHLTLGGLDQYADRSLNPHLGASIGRYANRIAGAAFVLDDRTYRLEANNGANTLHGGSRGWDRRVWELLDTEVTDLGGTAVFGLTSHDGDGGFPGTMTATATFTVDRDVLRILYEARTDSPTVVCMTNHGYWNLAGRGTIARHRLTLESDRVLPVDDGGIPTGRFAAVENTPFDLRSPTELGPVVESVPGGIDHCFVVRGEPGVVRPVALLECAESGRWMSVRSDQPGVQLYTGNGLRAPFEVHGSVSLETQAFPDTPNRVEFGSARLDPGEVYRNETELRFGTGAPPSS